MRTLFKAIIFISMVATWLILMQSLGLAETGREMTKRFEGFRSKPYSCTKGRSTVGYGFNLNRSTTNLYVEMDGSITRKNANKLFEKYYKDAVKDAKRYVGRDTFLDLSQVKRDILVDMAYNLGSMNLNKFKRMKKAIKEGDNDQVCAEMKDSKWCKQVRGRCKHHVKAWRRTK